MLKIAKVLPNPKICSFLWEFKGVNFARQAVYLLSCTAICINRSALRGQKMSQEHSVGVWNWGKMVLSRWDWCINHCMWLLILWYTTCGLKHQWSDESLVTLNKKKKNQLANFHQMCADTCVNIRQWPDPCYLLCPISWFQNHKIIVTFEAVGSIAVMVLPRR